MATKYKVSDLAKDLKVKNNEVIDLIEKYLKITKKGVSSLENEEISLVLSYFAQINEVDNFDEYFKLVKKETTPKKTTSKKDKNVKEKTEQKESISNKKSNAPNGQDENVKANDKHKEKKQAVKRQKMEKLELKPKLIQSKTEVITENENNRHIDTRSSNVDLSKYNEKYENYASNNRNQFKDNYNRKQKISKKSNKKRDYNSLKVETEAQKLQRLALERARKQQLKVSIPDEILVSELASKLKVTASAVIKKLVGLGVMAALNDTIDFDTASIVADELGAKVEHIVTVTIEDKLFIEDEDKEEDLKPRDPIVTVMGHVDHGKTSLLDKIRHSNVIAKEAGGITQHIGAYKVYPKDSKPITFLDTPGHEAFTSMRMRGANITDIAILVVAADDGIMPQTVEAINHAKAADVSIIVAINKIDKPEANIDKVMQELTEHELVPEKYGGDIVCVPVSAKTGKGIDELLSMINLVADIKELKANPNRAAKGVVVEAYLDKGKGPVATLLIQNGTLKQGDSIIAGSTVGHVRSMLNDKGDEIKEAPPTTPVEITGLTETPSAGDIFNVVENEKLARELVDKRKHAQKEEKFSSYNKVTLDNLFSQIKEGEKKELPIIVKADVQGSVEAIKQSLEKLSNDEVNVKVIHGGVGAINKSDVMLAEASNAIMIGFNVRPDNIAKAEADQKDIELRMYRVIYDAIEDVEQAMKGMLEPKIREKALGQAEVRKVYKISGVGTVCGCYVTEGKVVRSALIRVVRDGVVIVEDQIKSLKRFKDDEKEVAKGYECGIGLEKFNDLKDGDVFESFELEEYRD